ncbi:hypothetical protein ACIBQ1_43270 [Nonomuraea sp. NPDC050153]|uniref:hypothetical protein n=1 Tax=Nonomuraea sp. NPDC050153 TaxID=3364359 RepID=UPI0037A77896
MEYDASGAYAGLGVTHRMAVIGVLVDAWDEEVWARTASHVESLGVGQQSIVLVVERAYFASERTIEIADMIVPAESNKLIYNGPVGDSAGAEPARG